MSNMVAINSMVKTISENPALEKIFVENAKTILVGGFALSVLSILKSEIPSMIENSRLKIKFKKHREGFDFELGLNEENDLK